MRQRQKILTKRRDTLVGYEFQQSVNTPWPVMQIFILVDNQLSLIDSIIAPAEYVNGLGDIAWMADECKLITQESPWFPPTDFPSEEQVGFFIHDEVCNPLPEVLAIVQQLSACAD